MMVITHALDWKSKRVSRVRAVFAVFRLPPNISIYTILTLLPSITGNRRSMPTIQMFLILPNHCGDLYTTIIAQTCPTYCQDTRRGIAPACGFHHSDSENKYSMSTEDVVGRFQGTSPFTFRFRWHLYNELNMKHSHMASSCVAINLDISQGCEYAYHDCSRSCH